MTAPNTAPDMDVFDETANAVLMGTMKDSAHLMGDEDSQTRARDDHGRFVAEQGNPERKVDGEWNVLPDTPANEGEPVAAAGDGPAGEATPKVAAEPIIPEGFVKSAVLPPEKVQGFKVRDADGDIEAPDLTFDVNFRSIGADGRERVEVRALDTAQLVSYARMGVYNHEKEQRATEVQQQNHTLSNRVSQVEQYARQRDETIEKLLSDPDYLLSQLKQYEVDNTPENRVAREREQLRQERERSQYENVAQLGMQFVEGSLQPAIELITKACPSIDPDEVAAKLLLIVEPYKVRTPFGTTIHPNAYDRIRHAISGDVVRWAEQVHEHRSSRTAPKPSEKTPDPVKDAKPDKQLQERNQKLRRVATGALKPAGANQPQGKPQSSPIRSNRDLEDAVVGNALSAVLQRG